MKMWKKIALFCEKKGGFLSSGDGEESEEEEHVAVVATNNVYTKAAKTLAAELKVVLWDCIDLSGAPEP